MTTLVVLFLFTGSVVLPLKALALNVVSLGATLGVLVWVFQDGHLSGLLGGFQVTGDRRHLDDRADRGARVRAVDGLRGVPAVADQGGARRDGADTEAPSCSGLQRSGRIITAAAALLAVVFAAFVSSGVTNIKQLGIGRGVRDPARRDDHPRTAGAGLHGRARRPQLVGPRTAARRCTAGSGSPRAARPPSRHRHRHRLRRRKASRPSPQASDPLLPGQGVLLPGCDARGRPPAEPLRAAFRVHRRRGGASPGARRVAVSRSRSGRRSSG